MRKPFGLKILDGVTLLAFAVAVALVFFYAPLEAQMGAVQKVFYFHVAAGWTGMLGFVVAAVTSALYLITRNPRWDGFSVSGVEIGLVFMLINIVSGSIWAYPTWNTWWTWDVRLTTATIMELIYLAYGLLRQGVDDPERRRRFAAVYALLGFVSVPITFVSIRLFNSIHPVVIGAGGEMPTMAFTPAMQVAFFGSLIAFSFIFVDLFWHRLLLANWAERVDALKARFEDVEGGMK